MKTLTITDAKKNLGRWLAAAARGEDIGIICGCLLSGFAQLSAVIILLCSSSGWLSFPLL